MKVLVADDDLTSRSMLQAVMCKWGFEVEIACDGIEAWEALRREVPPGLTVLDWMMPGMDGVEVCRKVRLLDTYAPPYIILLTARGEKGDIVQGLEAGADDYLSKPFNNEELRARVRVGERVIELREALGRRVVELQEALAQVRKLQGIIPICAHCHKIRTDQEIWERIEKYIEEHSDAIFSHGICPQCMKKHYPEFAPESGPKGRS